MTDGLGKETGSSAESVTPSPAKAALKHAARPMQGPSGPAFRKAAEAATGQMEDTLRGRSTPKLEELAERNPIAQEVLEEREGVKTLSQGFNTLSDEQKEAVRQKSPEVVVKNMAGIEEVDRKQAEEYLRLVYDRKSDEEIEALLAKFDDQRARIQPAPEEGFGKREDGSTIQTKEELSDYVGEPERQENAEKLADDGRAILSMPTKTDEEKESKKAAIESWKSSLFSLFGDDAKNVLGKAIKYTTIASGILVILLMFFISWHTPSKQ